MTFDVALLVLLGAALHAIWNAAVKSASDKLLDAALVLFGTVLVIPVLLLILPLPHVDSLPYLAISVLIHIIYFLLVAFSYEHGDLTVVYPLMRGSALAITAVFAVFLFNEMPHALGWLGITLVSGGILSLAAGSAIAHNPRGVTFALLNAAVIVLYTLVDGRGARLSGNALAYTSWMFLLTALGVIAWVLQRKGPSAGQYLTRNWTKALLGGCCTFGSYGLALWAMTRAPIGLVAALRETSIVFGTVLAIGILKERPSKKRLLAILLVALGAVLIKLS